MANYRQLKHPCYVTLGYNHLLYCRIGSLNKIRDSFVGPSFQRAKQLSVGFCEAEEIQPAPNLSCVHRNCVCHNLVLFLLCIALDVDWVVMICCCFVCSSLTDVRSVNKET